MAFSAPFGSPNRWATVFAFSGPAERRLARRIFLALGILALVTGATAIVVPIVASIATAIFIGWILIVASAWMLVAAFAHRVTHSRWEVAWRVVSALLTLFVGIWLILAPLTGTLTLTFMLAAWLIALGVIELIGAWRMRQDRGVWIVVLAGALNFVLGVLIAVNLPSSAAWALGLLVGIQLVFWGTRSIALFLMLKDRRPI
jgi:uncharacterized membrane protein HdeD (DUF308 family)